MSNNINKFLLYNYIHVIYDGSVRFDAAKVIWFLGAPHHPNILNSKLCIPPSKTPACNLHCLFI